MGLEKGGNIAMKGLIPEVLAQATQQANESAPALNAPNPMMSLAPFAIIFIIFYFLMIRPQKRKLEEEQAMLGKLAKGDEVYTKSGLLGTVVGMTEKVITLEVMEGIKLKVLRHQIGGMSQKLFEKKGES